MQPTATASIPPPNAPADMDLQTVQSMDWLFKKERFYLLVQFWQQRATLAEKEVTTLKEQIANNTTNHCDIKEGSNMDRQTFETELAAKDKEINQLLEEVQRLQSTVSKLKESSFTQISRLEEQLEQKRQHISRLEAKLDLQRDYEDLKRELCVLRPECSPADCKPSENVRVKTPGSTTEQEVEAGPPSPPLRPFHLHHHTVENFCGMLDPVKTPTSGNDPSIINNHNTNSRERSVSTASTPQPQDLLLTTTTATTTTTQQQQHHHQTSSSSPSPIVLNGNPKSPHQAEDNNNHLSNNNLPPSMATMCAVNNFLRGDDSLKSPYRFDEHRSPFRFAEDLGMAPGSMVGRLGESLIPKGDPMEAKLQEMLRYNMDKYASQNLDTLHISRRVRELLSIHNIGQRLFAKYILGLSQGTVSELLSKPKPWDKLTEKGRDSYRKMHAWACDEQAILLLKSLIPKKDNFSSGKDSSSGGMPPFGRPDPEFTEDRIAHILSEATQFHNNLKDSGSQHHQGDDSRPSNDDSKSPSPFSKDSSQNRRLKKYENDDIPQEKVVRIYQEELAKLMGRRMEDLRTGGREREAAPFPGMFFPQLFNSAGGPMDRTQEEIRMALDAYHRELVKLNQTNPLLALQQHPLLHQMQQINGGVQDLSLPKDCGGISNKDKSSSGNNNNNNNNNNKMINGEDVKQEREPSDDVLRHSAFSLVVRPKIESNSTNSTASSPLGNNTILPPTDEFPSSNASPLQRMASITNSLISQPSSQPHHSSSQRPLKAVLPPITQQQFDQYNNLNTEDIVKKVKEQLSQYSISQRLFGESVLGLSQGSVSDLLARPKPWHMLTQKGREPFIRMKMFLEDDNAVHKLVASQYKIAPEKLMRTGGYGGANIPVPNKPMPPKMLTDAATANLINKMQSEQQNLLLPPNVIPPQPPPMLLTPPGVPPHHAISLANHQEHIKTSSKSSPLGHLTGMSTGPQPQQPNQVIHPPGQQGPPPALRGMYHMSPSVYEMAALTQDLDTQVITTKIKEALLANNIGQKIFGEAVLGLSQGSVSELLSKPKPWHMLSIKGREPFIRMQLWLNDAHNIDRLQALKNERREANKRRRSSGGPGAHDNSSDTSSNDTSEFYHSNSPGPGPTKKQRVLFSEEQKEALRLAFALDPYPNVATIEFLATELNLSSRTITNWFHNHRMRLKQQVPHSQAEIPMRDHQGSQGPFDPVHFRLLLNQRLLELSKERMGLGGMPPLPLPFAAGAYHLPNTNHLAALIGRGLLPGDVELLHHAVKEEMSGLDLSMTSSMKRDEADFDDDDDDDELDELRSEASSPGSLKTEERNHLKETPVRSRRKPAAPQWVNPDWQDPAATVDKEKQGPENEVIINGVCVMQTEDYGRRNSEETVRVEPTPVLDCHRFDVVDDDASNDSSDHNDDKHIDDSVKTEQEEGMMMEDEDDHEEGDDNGGATEDDQSEPKRENEDERWGYD